MKNGGGIDVNKSIIIYNTSNLINFNFAIFLDALEFSTTFPSLSGRLIALIHPNASQSLEAPKVNEIDGFNPFSFLKQTIKRL